MQAATIVPFRQSKLLLVNHEGQPFVPMKPVVQGMGMDWASQFVKLQGGRFKPTVVEITMVAEDGKQREMTCLPLRKLPGWLMSIHPNKVRPELREGIIAYQNEWDDVLWSYWNDGMAVRRDDRTVETVLNSTIGTDGFHMLGAVLDGKVRHLPAPARRRAKMHIWSQVHKAFSVVSAEDIPATSLDAARNFIGSYSLPLEGEWIEREKPAAATRLNIHFPVDYLSGRRPGMQYQRNEHTDYLDVHPLDLVDPHESPCELILTRLTKAGYDVDAAWWEVRTYRNKLAQMHRAIESLKRNFESPQQYVIAKPDLI
ncbi:phage antirepressor N-terminal domain-containing protein [Azotobacter vinelandii]|uniref:phage antirepressor N-terminal domain-containing protein n=1 Tax=Azotobacter vinelandii TaxID=354 RepID=UPI0009104740|nr:phage antirepressor N-terminal domain-containing protein [Azotobacter vinelandii]SFY16168.1 P22_AR N-terminal domain-containing protein [Azotobacter vinelandii]